MILKLLQSMMYTYVFCYNQRSNIFFYIKFIYLNFSENERSIPIKTWNYILKLYLEDFGTSLLTLFHLLLLSVLVNRVLRSYGFHLYFLLEIRSFPITRNTVWASLKASIRIPSSSTLIWFDISYNKFKYL